MYLVEPAKSNRALCKQCKVKIDKGLLRIGTVTPGPGDYDITSWRHLECQKMPKGLDLANLTGFDALTPSFRNVQNRFSVKYFLNLVLIDEEDRRYFKQQEITLFRK